MLIQQTDGVKILVIVEMTSMEIMTPKLVNLLVLILSLLLMLNIQRDFVLLNVLIPSQIYIIEIILQRSVLWVLTVRQIILAIILLNIVSLSALSGIHLRHGDIKQHRLAFKNVMVLYGVMIQLEFLYV